MPCTPPPPSPNHGLRLGSNPLTPIISDPDDGSAAQSPPPSPSSSRVRFTVNDVLGTSGRSSVLPTEDQVETRILRNAEQQQVNIGVEDQQNDDALQEAQLLRDLAEADADAANMQREEMHPLLRASRKPTTAGDNDDSDGDKDSEDGKVHLKTEQRNKVHYNSWWGHRRTKTVEQQLFGLATELAQRHDNNDTSVDDIRSSNNSYSSRHGSSRWDHAMEQTAQAVVGHAHKQAEKQVSKNSGHLGEDVEAGTLSSQQTNNNNQQTGKPTATSTDVKDDLDDTFETNYSIFREFVSAKRASTLTYLRRFVMYIGMPSMGMATLLFYGLGNPIAPSWFDKTTQPASWSWWFLFVGVRHPLVFNLAVALQVFLIQFIVLRTRWLSRWMGPIVTLYLVQSKGWPFLCGVWSALSLLLLVGPEPHVQHWLYWQSAIGMFNEQNTAGTITTSHFYWTGMITLMTVAFCVTVKRLLVSLFLGRTTFAHFGEPLADNMKNMLLIGDIAALAKRMERKYGNQDSDKEQILRQRAESADSTSRLFTRGSKTLLDLVREEATAQEQTEQNSNQPSAVAAANAFLQSRTTIHPQAPPQAEAHYDNNNPDSSSSTRRDFSDSAKMKMTQLLDEWEEPNTHRERRHKTITLSSVLQFRQALTLMSNKYPFSPAYGLADTREACVESAQQVYERLLLRTPGRDELPFETLALCARIDKHTVDEEKIRELISIFRPDRVGRLERLDFVRSIDKIYKSIRLLSTNINNAKHTDAAVQSILDVVFWAIMVAFILTQFGMDPLQLLVSLSTLFITFAFMFGRSFSKYIEGILFILLQRPYGVGDRIHLSKPDTDTNRDGSSGWIVEDITLYKTTLYWGATNERATLANGAISDFRVINASRSPNATIYVDMTFAIDTSSDMIETFREAVVQFLKDRPREWLSFGGFRPTKVAVDQGYINYIIIAQHRNSWQDIGGILSSKADLVKFCLEIAKQLDMSYMSPPLPVELSIQAGDSKPSGIFTPETVTALGGR